MPDDPRSPLAAQAIPAVGPIIWDGRYEIVRTIGEGGMGRVVLAEDLARARRRVALKILLPDYLNTIPTFLREYAVQRRLSHPNLPRAFALGFAHQPRAALPYFSMEFAPGVPLLVAMQRGASLRTVFAVCADVLRALDHLHRRGFVHRDLKPGNILVHKDGGGSLPFTRLIDLGVAAPIGTDGEDGFIGTPEYAAPELLTGEPVDGRSDLYSLGLVLYELIEHRRPWPGSDEIALATARVRGPIPPLTAPDCPPALAALVHDLLAPRPEDRPADAVAVLERLVGAVGHDGEIEPAEAFARRLEVIPPPYVDRVDGVVSAMIANLVDRSQKQGPDSVVIGARKGMDGQRLTWRAGEQAAARGARVIEARLERHMNNPLSALAPVLEVLARLQPMPELGPDDVMDAPAAARVLARGALPLVVLIHNLQRADGASLGALAGALDAGRGYGGVRLVASCDVSDATALDHQLRAFLRRPTLARVEIPPMSGGDIDAWLNDAVGLDALHPEDAAQLRTRCRGSAIALRQGLTELYRSGRVVRVGDHYAAGAGAAGAGPAIAADRAAAAELEELLTCVVEPLEEAPLARYLGEHASHLPELLASGVLVKTYDGRLIVDDEGLRNERYAALDPGRRQRLHRRVAMAVEAVGGAGDDHHRIAAEYMRSDAPLLAVPPLTMAAANAPLAGGGADAREQLATAELLLNEHGDEATESLDLWRYWSLLWRAASRVAAASGDLASYEAAVESLITLGTEMAHRQTLEVALAFRMDLDRRRGDWNGLVDDAAALTGLNVDEVDDDANARLAWARGLRYAADGAPEQALTQLNAGLAYNAERLSPDVELELFQTRAELLLGLAWPHDARRAVAEYEEAAYRRGRILHLARARLLESQLLRLTARPDEALLGLRRLVRELSGERMPGLDAHLELELAHGHLAFGWFDSAVEHAAQARALAEQEGDLPVQVRAILAEADAVAHRGESDVAYALAQRAERLAGAAVFMAQSDAKLVALRYALVTVGFRDADKVGKAAAELGWRAHRRQESERASRAFATAARAALVRGDKILAREWSQLALNQLDPHLPDYAGRPVMLQIAGEAHALSGDDIRAMDHLDRARHELNRAADRMTDPTLRKAWLAHPDHARILGRG